MTSASRVNSIGQPPSQSRISAKNSSHAQTMLQNSYEDLPGLERIAPHNKIPNVPPLHKTSPSRRRSIVFLLHVQPEWRIALNVFRIERDVEQAVLGYCF